MSEGTKTLDIAELAKRIVELERLVGILTRERDAQPLTIGDPWPPLPVQPHYPVIPGVQPYVPITPTLPDLSKCGKCGLTLGPVMGYCCPNADCPCGLGGTSCMATG
jgi:hypothetical protein